MQTYNPLRWRLRRLALAIICLGIMAGPLAVSAAAGGCRADPIVWLSNGTKVTMIASIAADASHVKLVTYTLHAPRRGTVDKVVYTGGVLQSKERVVVLFDRTSDYLIEARADLGTTVASVTINATVEQDKRSTTASSSSAIVFVFP